MNYDNIELRGGGLLMVSDHWFLILISYKVTEPNCIFSSVFMCALWWLREYYDISLTR